MLSDTDVIQLVHDGTISLSYTFLPDQAGLFVRTQRTLRASIDQTAFNFFQDHLVRSRLALTLGPLVKPVSQFHRIAKGKRFIGHKRIVDLRNCSDGWALLPGQSAVICTNEHIRLPSDIVALIVGRVSSYNNGLVTTASYLDSGWDGIVKLLMTNTSQKPVRLYLGLEVGRIFFDRTPGASVDTSAVGGQSIHYGMNWTRILDDRLDPFPQSPAPAGVRARLALGAANDILQRYAGVGLITVAVVGLIGAINLYRDAQHYLNQSTEITRLRKEVKIEGQRLPVSGTAKITVRAGRTAVQTIVDVPGDPLYRGLLSNSFVVIRTDTKDIVVVSKVEQSASGGVALVLTAQVSHPAATNSSIVVTWSYLP